MPDELQGCRENMGADLKGAFGVKDARLQPRLSRNKRGDELVLLDGRPDILIGLKVEADGGDAQIARWVHRAAALEIKARLAEAGRHLVKRIIINHDPNGSAVDLWLHTPEELGVGVELFAKWRIGRGLEVHVGAWGVPQPGEPRQVVAALRERLRPALLEALRPLSSGEPTVSRRQGKSGLIVRAVNDGWSVLEGVSACRAGLAAVEPVLAATEAG